MSRSGIPTGSAIAQPPAQNQQKSIIEIYTDWANHYLDKLPKARRRKISDLQTELNDGLVLADVIEAVTGHKIGDINRKPRSPGHMADNIQRCLEFLHSTGVQGLEEIASKEIRDGNLKAILGLFFQLSRFKQQQKQLQKGTNGSLLERTGTPRIPSVPNSPAKMMPPSSSAIPSPLKKTSSSDGKKSTTMLSKIGSGRQLSSSSLKQPSPSKKVVSAIPAPPPGQGGQQLPPRQEKTSMLEKLKLKRSTSAQKQNGTNNVQMQQQHQQQQQQQMTLLPMPSGGHGQVRYQYRETGLGKRTSSSSGFSSARSVGSESSVSLSSDTNFPSPSALRRINENSTFSNSSPKKSIPSPPGNGSNNNSPRHHPQSPKQQRSSGLKKFSSPRNSAAGSSSSNSPKRSPKFQQRANNGGTEIKDYGMIDGVVPSQQTAATKHHHPPQHNSQLQQPKNITTRLPQPPGITGTGGGGGHSRIPGFSAAAGPGAKSAGGRIPSSSSGISNPNKSSSTKSEATVRAAAAASAETTMQSSLVKPLQHEDNPSSSTSSNNAVAAVSNSAAAPASNEEGDNIMTASFQSRSCSLPRQKRREDGSPGPPANVAVVSPMPSLKKGASLDSSSSTVTVSDPSGQEVNPGGVATAGKPNVETSSGKEATPAEDEEGLKSLVPMQPIFGEQASSASDHSRLAATADPKSHYGFIGQATTLVSASALTGIRGRFEGKSSSFSFLITGLAVILYYLWMDTNTVSMLTSVQLG